MTADPLRPPEQADTPPVGADTPPDVPADAATTGVSAASQPTAGQGMLTPEAAASAEAAAAAEAVPATEPVATADDVTTAGAVTTAQAVAATQAAADSPPAETGPRRRTAVIGRLRQIGIFVIAVAFFAGGVALGNYAFQASRPSSTGVAGGVDTHLGEPPTITKEFVAALAANDADALRSSLAQGPHIDLTREMERYGIQRVDNVEILGTQVDGGRSATEILMEYQRTDGVPFAINLVVLVDGTQIEGFR